MLFLSFVFMFSFLLNAVNERHTAVTVDKDTKVLGYK